MQLREFRVQMYKGIVDSGPISTEPLTVLVGKNESGKTSILEALHKLNPATPKPYQIEQEWPRGRCQRFIERRQDAGAVPAFYGIAAKRCPGSSAIERMAHEGDDWAGRFVVKPVADRQGRAKIVALEPQISRRWQTPGRPLP